MILTIFIVLASIIALMVIHEFGHFIMAKKFGVRVEEFGVGLPPRLIGKKIGETVYSLNLLPFGAFVKIHGEDERADDKNSFSKKPIWQRALILLAGVVSFWLVAIILLTIVFHIGTFQAITDEEAGPLINPQVQIVGLSAASPAQEAGLQMADIIIELRKNNEKQPVTKVEEVQNFVAEHRGEEIILLIKRGRQEMEIPLIPRTDPPQGEGAMGVSLVRIAEQSFTLPRAFVKGVQTTLNLTAAIVISLAELLAGLVTGRGLPAGMEVMGPIGIGSMAVQAVQVGASYFLQFIAIIAIYLAIFNLLPIPALDGGRLLFLLIEKIKGKPVNQTIEQRVTVGFFLFFILLMVLVTIKDIARLF